MKARVKDPEVEVISMSRYDYLINIKRQEKAHTEYKWVNGYYCIQDNISFWLPEDKFNQLFDIIK